MSWCERKGKREKVMNEKYFLERNDRMKDNDKGGKGDRGKNIGTDGEREQRKNVGERDEIWE